MPPKKDDKKGKGGAGVQPREVDPTHYVRKSTPVPAVDESKDISLPRPCGKIIRLENLFPEWSTISEENWTEPVAVEKLIPIQYPSYLNVHECKPFTTFFELEADAPVDPKAKKKEEKKKPAKGKEEVVEIVELTVNDAGKTLPVVYRGDDFMDFHNELRAFADNCADSVLVNAFRLISLFGSNMAKHETNPNSTFEEFKQGFLWRSIYPQTTAGKPVFSASGKYCVRVFVANVWRKVYVDDTVPVTSEGRPSIAFSADRMELWPLLLAKAVYAVYCANEYRFLDEPLEDIASSTKETADDGQAMTGRAETDEEISTRLLQLKKKQTQSACEFLSFAIHTLTGWQPHRFMSRKVLFANLHSQSAKIINSMKDVGVPFVSMNDIVQEDHCFYFEKESLSLSTEEGNTDPVESPINEDNPSNEMKDKEIILTNGDDSIVLKTKRRFKEEYQARKIIRDDIISRVLQREARIDRISTALDRSCAEFFCVVRRLPCAGGGESSTTTYEWDIRPLLAVAVPEDASPDADNVEQVQLLINWRRRALRRVVPNVDDKIILGQGAVPVKEFMEPFPLASPLESEWVSVEQLIAEQAFIVPFFTLTDTPYCVHWDRRWAPLSPYLSAAELAEKEKESNNAKGKDKKPAGKDKDKGAEAEKECEIVASSGQVPITFLSLDISTLLQQARVQQQQSMSQLLLGDNDLLLEGDRTAEANGEDEESVVALREQAEAIAGQQLALAAVNSVKDLDKDVVELVEAEIEGEDNPRRILPPVSSIVTLQSDREDLAIPLVVTLTGDLVQGLSETTVREGTVNRKEEAKEEQSGTTQKRRQYGESVLVMQEVCFDDRTPLVFVAKMSGKDGFPKITKSFTVPASTLRQRLQEQADDEFAVGDNDAEDNSRRPKMGNKLFFWLRLYSHDSLRFQFHSSVPLSIGQAETEWTSAGGQVFLYQGESDPTVDETEQLLFRLPLFADVNKDAVVMPSEGDAAQQQQHSVAMTQHKHRDFVSRPTTAMGTNLSTNAPMEQRSLAFLSVNDLAIERACQLMSVTVENGHPTLLTELPSITGQVLALSKTVQRYESLIGLVQQPQRGSQIPRFPYQLLVLSHVPMKPPPKSIVERAVTQTFAGKYVPNHRQCLFRDVYSIERESFPIAFKLNITALDAQSLPLDDTLVLLRFYRKHDNKMVVEYSGSVSIHSFHVDIAHFLDPEKEQQREQQALLDKAAAENAKDSKAKAKGAVAAPAVECVDLIVECVLDSRRMGASLPHHWISRFPHVFDDLFVDPNLAAEVTPPQQQLQQELLQQQSSLLVEKPPQSPVLIWEVEVLSGRVQSVSHDISSLTRQAAVRKQWEAQSAGRTERAVAAANYLRERGFSSRLLSPMFAGHQEDTKTSSTAAPVESSKAEELASSDDDDALSGIVELSAECSADGSPMGRSHRDMTMFPNESHESEKIAEKPQTEVPLTGTMAENMSSALGIDQDVVKQRFALLHELPVFHPKVSLASSECAESFLCPSSSSHAMGTAEWLAAVEQQRDQEKTAVDNRFKSLLESSAQLNALYREQSQQRIQSWNAVLRAQRQEAIEIFAQREAYRVEIEQKNASLQTLLKRGKDARAAATAAEAAAEAERLKQEAKNAKKKK